MEPRADTNLQKAALKAWAAYCEVSQNEEQLREALHDRTVRCEDLWEAMATVEEMGFGALRAALDAAGIPDTIAVDAAWARPLDHGAEARLVVTHTGRTLYSRTLPTRYETEVSFKETLADIAADILAALRRPALAVATPSGTIIAERSTDSEFPGIWVRIERPGQAGQPNAAAVCVEYQNGEYAGSPRFAVRTYREGVDEYLHNTDWGSGVEIG